jgi:RNA polymerase sigma-70 factor (sigma-E family)
MVGRTSRSVGEPADSNEPRSLTPNGKPPSDTFCPVRASLPVMETNATPVTERTHVEPDRSTMADLYARYVPTGVRLAYLMTGDRHQAEDLAQEAFVRCVGRFSHLRSHAAFDAYLRRAIVNLHTSGLRRRRLEREWLQREGHRVVNASSSQADVGERADLWAALATLPARQRAALVLRYYEDLSERDTAEALGCSLAAVKSLVARGSEALRAHLPTYPSEGDES